MRKTIVKICIVLSAICMTAHSCQKEELASVKTAEVSEISLNSATSGGSIVDDGNSTIIKRGVCWNTSSNPTIDNLHTTNGSGEGSFVSHLNGLLEGKTYYVRAYAINNVGIAYGNELSFESFSNPDVPTNLPTITTNTILNIEATTATCSGNVTFDGNSAVTAKGVCWSTTQNPTVANAHTTDGSGIGSFTSNLTGLTQETTYYVRAYATNEKGTAYGEQKSFITLSNSQNPIATTISANQTDSDYSSTGFYLNGYYYNYTFDYTLNFSFLNTQYADTIGFYLNGGKWYWDTFSDGPISANMMTYSNSSPITITYQAYAVKNDGSYVYGEEKSLYLHYGGKNSPQQINLNLNINENSIVSTINVDNKKSLDAPCEKKK